VHKCTLFHAIGKQKFLWLWRKMAEFLTVRCSLLAESRQRNGFPYHGKKIGSRKKFPVFLGIDYQEAQEKC
jgi:hypothetical protein